MADVLDTTVLIGCDSVPALTLLPCARWLMCVGYSRAMSAVCIDERRVLFNVIRFNVSNGTIPSRLQSEPFAG